MQCDLDLAKLKICFVAGTLGQGGAEQQLYYMLRCLHAEGADVQLLSLTSGEFWEQRIRDLGVPVHWVGDKGSRIVRAVTICRVTAKMRPSIVQSSHFYTNLYAAAAARVCGARDIGAIRNDVWSELRSNGRALGQLSLRVPVRLAANSMQAIRNGVQAGIDARRLSFVPNVVDTERFRPSENAGPGAVRVLSVGRMVVQKRFDRLLRVMAMVRERLGLVVPLLIAGEGPLRGELEALAKELHLGPEALTMPGTFEDMAPLYHEADFLLLTSDHEGTPNVALEAMACGLPVVATRVGGVADIVEHGKNGLLAAHDDLRGLVDHVTRLCEDFELRHKLGSQARRFVETEHSEACLPSKLKLLYRAAFG